MKATIEKPCAVLRPDVEASLLAMRKTMERARKDKAFAFELLLATGMYTKTGQIKKRFR